MKKEITGFHLLFISFAAIFGSGWLFAPFYAAKIAGSASLLAWILGIGISAVIGMTMAEVIVLYPKTGGLNQLAKITHGDFLSVAVTLFNLFVFIILPAIETRAVVQYLSAYFQFLILPGGGITVPGYLLALGLLSLITLVNLYGAKITVFLTKVIVFFKLITPILICVSFFSVVGESHSFDPSRLSFSWGSIPWNQVFQAIATSGIIFSFNGFNQATLFAGETANPKKAIPFAILGSLLLSGVLYILVQSAFLVSVPQASLAGGWGQLSFTGDQGPFIGLASLLGLGWLLTIIYTDAVVSPLGTAFAYASAAPRLIYSFGELSASRFPVLKVEERVLSRYSILITLFLECLAFLFLQSIQAMIALLVAAFVLCYTTAPASLLTLRREQPHLERPFKVKMAPFVSFLSIFFSNLMVFSCGWVALRNLVWSLVVILLIYLVSCIREKVSFFSRLLGSKWFLFQVGSIAVLCYSNHQSQMDFSTSTVWVAAISLVSLMASQYHWKKQIK